MFFSRRRLTIVLVDLLNELVRRHAAGRRPSFSAARVLVFDDGKPTADLAYGVEAAYADRCGVAVLDRVPVTTHTRFDIASITKLFTAATVLEVLADHGLNIETPVYEALPAYDDDKRREIRFRHLLTHTAGLPATWCGWNDNPSVEQARERLFDLTPTRLPGLAHDYSCIGYIHAGFAIEAIVGRPLDELVADKIIRPLGMSATGYLPPPTDPIAATEWQEYPLPGISRGVVHDETARALGGVSGNAGLFSTAADVARFGEELRTGERNVLQPETRDLMTHPVTRAGINPDYEQAAGTRIGDWGNFGRLGNGGYGHTGFTGTMLLVHPKLRLTLVTLTNRVHPSREWSDPSVFRRDVIELVAKAAEGR